MIIKQEEICRSDCLYFPPLTELEFRVDKNGVKRRINNEPYKCLYDGKKISLRKKCSNCTLIKKDV